MEMKKSFKNTVLKLQKRKSIKGNSLIANNIKKTIEYKASLNELSPIVAYVVNERRNRNLRRQYLLSINSKVRNM